MRVDAAPAYDPMAEAVQYANILTGVDPDEEIATRAPDDPDDQLAGSASDDEDDDDEDDRDKAHHDDDDDGGARDHNHDRDHDREVDRSDAGGGRGDGGPGELALLDDAEIASAPVTGDDADLAASSAGASEAYEARMRSQRSSILGRFDVGIAWRRHTRAPMHAPSHVDDQLWLLATWRR